MNITYEQLMAEGFEKLKHHVLGYNVANDYFLLSAYSPHYLINTEEKEIIARLDVLIWAKKFPGINLFFTTDDEIKIVVSVKWRGQDFHGYPIGRTLRMPNI